MASNNRSFKKQDIRLKNGKRMRYASPVVGESIEPWLQYMDGLTLTGVCCYCGKAMDTICTIHGDSERVFELEPGMFGQEIIYVDKNGVVVELIDI